DYTVQLYQQEHEGKLPPTNSKDAEWVQWRADKITEYVKDLFKAIKAHNPQAIVSVSPNPQEFSLEYYLLDWQRWERIGLIEELVLQVYRNNLADYLREITQASVIAAQKHIPVAIGILAGLKGRPVSFNLIDEQIKAARANQLAGVSFFFYESLWHLSDTSPEIRKANFAEVFRHCRKYTTDF
ncbi:MAG: glycoside hydrolase family 10 protein, partial [Cyanobacteria bacterium J083]